MAKEDITGILSPHLSRSHVILAAAAASLITIVTICIVPFGALPCPIFPPFVLMSGAMTSIMTALMAYFFAIQFRSRREPLIGALSGAFGYMSVLMFSQIFVFPGVLSTKSIFAGGAESSVWMWILWHLGFPVFILIGVLLHKSNSAEDADKPIKNIGLALIPGGPAVAIVLVYFCIAHSKNLPILISGLNYQGLRQSLFIPLIIGATILAFVTCAWITKLRDLLSLWLAIALLASVSDAILTLSANVRYDLGWYAGRMLSITASSIVFCVLIYEVSRLYDQLAEAHRVLAERVMRDGLTGAFNRRYFSEHFPREVLRAKRESTAISLLMVDVDNFKTYNDLYGHQQGDECLTNVAIAIQDITRRPGDVTARYGGEEFAIILPKTDFFGARQIAENIRSAVAALEFTSEDGSVHAVTVSIGLETLNPAEYSLSPEELLKRADQALYRAKHQGRNVVRSYGPDLNCTI